eukprot:gene24315-biopygen9959
MRARDVPGPCRMVLSGLVPCSSQRMIGMMLGKRTGRDISRCGKGGVRLYPTKCCHMGLGGGCIRHLAGSRKVKWVTNLRVSNTQTSPFARDRQLRFQLDSSREHPPREISSPETGHGFDRLASEFWRTF